MCSFLSKQKKRAYRVAVNYLDNKRYCGMFSLLTTGDLFGTDMCYDLIPNYLDPYDFETFGKYEGKAYAVVTNIRTGKAEYMQLKDMHEDILAVRASSSMPLVSRKVKIGEEYYLDGGLADALPMEKVQEEGWEKLLVILTRKEDYRKKYRHLYMFFLRLLYHKYPQLIKTVAGRAQKYNACLDEIDRMEKEGKAIVLRPSRLAVGNNESNVEVLMDYYQHGYEEAMGREEEIFSFLTT